MELPTPTPGGGGGGCGVCSVTAHSPTPWGPQELSGSSPKRRRAEDKDEGIGSPDIWEDEKAEDLRREMIELRQQLDKERSVRMMLEEQVRRVGWQAGDAVQLSSFPPVIYGSSCFVPGLGEECPVGSKAERSQSLGVTVCLGRDESKALTS